MLDNQQKHNEYSQRCNLHLSYLGKGSYVQHEIRIETVVYNVFGLPEPVKLDMHTVSIAVGMCTADESETLDKLLQLGIISHTIPTKSTLEGAELKPQPIDMPVDMHTEQFSLECLIPPCLAHPLLWPHCHISQ